MIFHWLYILGFNFFWSIDHRIVVDQNGKGDFTAIQPAIDFALQRPDIHEIYIHEGIYTEKLFIDSLLSNLTFKGSSKDEVTIRYTQSRDIWRCSHPDDYGAAVINVKGRDLKFLNLTVINDFGSTISGDTTIYCPNAFSPSADNGSKEHLNKKVAKDSHQFAFRSFPGATRIVWDNCDFISDGGDTVSPWDVQNGLYYMKNCTVSRHVDAWCPRGYALAENCVFYGKNKHALVWHDGVADKNSKSVMKNCRFEGDAGFALGRYHKDSQQYFFDCTFAATMADKPIYKAGNGALLHGHRVFFNRCKKEGKSFDWYKDNTDIRSDQVTFEYVFGDKWRLNNK
jgi:pectinesterase